MQQLLKIGGRLLLTLAVLLAPQLAEAVGVKPLRTELVIEPGAQAEFTLQIINDKAESQRVKPILQIYTKNDENGYPVAEELPAGDPRDISSWITFTQKELVLPANNMVKDTIRVRVPKDAEPGGRYIAVMYEPILAENNNGAVQINTRVASLLLITVAGEEKRTGELLGFELSKTGMLGDRAAQFAVHFKNTGNTHLAPKGTIRIFDDKNQLVTKIASQTSEAGNITLTDEIIINEQGGNVLPGSQRIFSGNWNQNVANGKYMARLELQFPGLGKPFTAETKLEIDEQMALSDLKFVPAAGKEPSAFVLSLKNSGNFQERLQGKLVIQNAYETTVAELELPKDAPYVQPGKTAELRLPWIAKVPEGRHVATLQAEYGLQHAKITDSVSFGGNYLWLLWIALGVAGAAGLGYGAFYFGQKAARK